MAKTKQKSRAKAKRPVKAKSPTSKTQASKTQASKSRTKSARKTKRAIQETDWRVTCNSLDDVRAQIDMLDQLITPLLCKRQYFVETAANFKPSVAGVVVQSRVEAIIQKVRAIAEGMKGDPATIERVYRDMIAAFTAAEQRRWRDLHGGKSS